MDVNEDMDEAFGREWQVERVLEPKDALIPKGMKTIAKTLRHAGSCLRLPPARILITLMNRSGPLSRFPARTAPRSRRLSAS